jgi:hypothetical protein
MLFCPSNFEDIHRYYRHTYVKFPERGDELFYIRNVERFKLTGTHESGDEFVLHFSEEKPYNVEFVIPHKSFFQHKTRAYLLQRIPAKQYNRGICANNTIIQSLNKHGGLGNHDLGFELLKAYIAKPAFPSFDKALTTKGSKIHSVVLSSRFAYVPEQKIIFADHISVATVDHAKHEVNVIHSVFLPELVALAKDSIFKVQPHAKTV